MNNKVPAGHFWQNNLTTATSMHFRAHFAVLNMKIFILLLSTLRNLAKNFVRQFLFTFIKLSSNFTSMQQWKKNPTFPTKMHLLMTGRTFSTWECSHKGTMQISIIESIVKIHNYPNSKINRILFSKIELSRDI